jgi:hypothetical protein
MREDFIRLLSIDAHSKIESRALTQMRRALSRVAAAKTA